MPAQSSADFSLRPLTAGQGPKTQNALPECMEVQGKDMFVLANFFQALAAVTGYVLEILKWLIIIRALLSWVNPDPYNPIVQFIERSTEWILEPFRRWIPSYKIGLDLSPIFAILLIYFLQTFLVPTLMGFAARLH